MKTILTASLVLASLSTGHSGFMDGFWGDKPPSPEGSLKLYVDDQGRQIATERGTSRIVPEEKDWKPLSPDRMPVKLRQKPTRGEAQSALRELSRINAHL